MLLFIDTVFIVLNQIFIEEVYLMYTDNPRLLVMLGDKKTKSRIIW